MKEFIANNIVSWIIEIAILAVIAAVTISEVRKTNEQTREMLTAISDFAAERQEAVGEAIDDLAFEASQVDIEGDINIEDVGNAAKDLASDWLNRDNDARDDQE